MEKLTKYMKQTKINEFKEKGITFEPYVQQFTWPEVINGEVVMKVINEIKHTDVWIVKKPKVKSRKALQEQGIGEIVSAEGWFYDSPNAKYVLENESGFRVESKDYLNYYYASTVGELIDDYNRNIVFDPNEKC